MGLVDLILLHYGPIGHPMQMLLLVLRLTVLIMEFTNKLSTLLQKVVLLPNTYMHCSGDSR